MEVARGFLPVSSIDEIIPVRNLIIDGTPCGRASDTACAVAVRHSAVHATRCLFPDLLFGKRQDKFTPMFYPLRDRLIVAVLALDFQKPGDLAHTYSAACIVAAFSFAISASARRYSTGITLRNSGR